MIVGDKPSISGPGGLYTRRLQAPDAAPREVGGVRRSEAEQDEVQISSEALLLQKAIEQAAAPDAGRQERVNELRDQIAKGQYEVPFAKLAKRLTDNG